jgi:hypothetical protein
MKMYFWLVENVFYGHGPVTAKAVLRHLLEAIHDEHGLSRGSSLAVGAVHAEYLGQQYHTNQV